jgi:hypothetical protein
MPLDVSTLLILLFWAGAVALLLTVSGFDAARPQRQSQ